MRYPRAKWSGSVNFSTTPIEHVRVVVHVMQGTLEGTAAWFNNPAAQVSAHFGVGKDGTVLQFVDTDQTAWAEMEYNGTSISIEHEGFTGEHLTPQQMEADAELFGWIHEHYKIPYVFTRNPGISGFIGHGSLGVVGGDHISCPGEHILSDVNKIMKGLLRETTAQFVARTIKESFG